MSGQGASSADTASGGGPTEPKASLAKKSKPKHGKPKKNRNAIKNAKIGKITKAEQDAKQAAKLTAIDDTKSDEISNLIDDPQEISKQSKDPEPVVDPIPAETSTQTITEDAKITVDQATADTGISKEDVCPAEEKTTTTMIPVEEEKQDPIAANNLTNKDSLTETKNSEATEGEAAEGEAAEGEAAEGAKLVKVFKPKNRKRRNRKTSKNTKPAVVSEVLPEPDCKQEEPSAIEEKEPGAIDEEEPKQEVPSYSEMVKPINERSTDEPDAGTAEPRTHSPRTLWRMEYGDSTSDEYDGIDTSDDELNDAGNVPDEWNDNY